MNDTVENRLFGFPKVKWLQYTGKVGKCTSFRCQIFSGFNTPKVIKIGNFLTELFLKRWTFFWDTVYIDVPYLNKYLNMAVFKISLLLLIKIKELNILKNILNSIFITLHSTVAGTPVFGRRTDAVLRSACS